jgi:trigger factor
MSIKVERLNSANASIEATIVIADIEKKVEDLARKVARTTKIDGFRKGKVPVTVVKQRYAEQLKQDAEGDTVRSLIDNALKELELTTDKLIGEPQFTKYDKKEDVIEVNVKFGIKPEIEVVEYSDVVPDVAEADIADADVEARIKELGKAQASLKKVEGRDTVETGDSVLMDFEGFVDDKAFEGGKAEGFTLEIGSGQFIPGFEDQMVAMKVGETKDIMVTFPENYGSKDLAGKEAKFVVTVHEIQRKEEVELNDELAKKMLPNEENATLDMVKEKVIEQMKSEAMSKKYNEELKPQIVENLIAKFSFDLPDFVVEQEMDLAFNNKLRTLSQEELDGLKGDQEKAKAMRDEFREEAEKSVKVTFLIDALAREEKIDVTENEIMQTIYYEAMMMGQEPKRIIEYYQQNNLLPAIKMAMVEDKLLTHLLDKKLKANKE